MKLHFVTNFISPPYRRVHENTFFVLWFQNPCDEIVCFCVFICMKPKRFLLQQEETACINTCTITAGMLDSKHEVRYLCIRRILEAMRIQMSQLDELIVKFTIWMVCRLMNWVSSQPGKPNFNEHFEDPIQWMFWPLNDPYSKCRSNKRCTVWALGGALMLLPDNLF